MIILKHTPIIQILLPFLTALLCVVINNENKVNKLSKIASWSNLILSVIAYILMDNEMVYYFGDFIAPVGIEYRINSLSQLAIIWSNFVLVFVLSSFSSYIKESITSYLPMGRKNLFYAILLFAHCGFLGMISTNDLFNLYVFIEISSLASYVLISCSNNKKAAGGALDYLMLGSIGATLILIGIGFLLAETGTLNIDDISLKLREGVQFCIAAKTGVIFCLIGALLKTSFFPLHFWMKRAYKATSIPVLCYSGGISTVVGIVVFVRLTGLVDDIAVETYQYFFGCVKIISLTAIVLGSYFAYQTKDSREVIIYSAVSNVGYMFFIISLKELMHILPWFLLADSITKIALILTIGDDERLRLKPKFAYFYQLYCSSGMPISLMFFVKILLLQELLDLDLYLEFAVIILGSALGILYNINLMEQLFFTENTMNKTVKARLNSMSVNFLVLLQISGAFLFYYVQMR